jgi:hypothetical protein
MILLKKQFEESFKSKEKIISKKINLKDDYLFQYSTTEQNNILEIFDQKTKKLAMRVSYHNIGTFDTFSGVWRWGWCSEMINFKLAELSKKVKLLGQDIEKNYKKYQPEEADLYHFYTTNGYFYTSQNRIPDIIAMAMEQMEVDWFFSIRRGVDDVIDGKISTEPVVIDYLALDKVLQIV